MGNVFLVLGVFVFAIVVVALLTQGKSPQLPRRKESDGEELLAEALESGVVDECIVRLNKGMADYDAEALKMQGQIELLKRQLRGMGEIVECPKK